MVKLTVAVVAIALAGTASAAKWRDLRVDGSSEEAFAQSLEVFKDKLPPSRWYTFDHVLGHIWLQETLAAAAEQRKYTRDDYLRQLDGLTYNEIGRVLDPTGKWAQRIRAQYFYARGGGGAAFTTPESPWPNQGGRPAGGYGTNAASLAQQRQQCQCAAPNGPQGN
jgi:hypothetical protein